MSFARRPRMNRRGIGSGPTGESAPPVTRILAVAAAATSAMVAEATTVGSNPPDLITSPGLTVFDWWRPDLGVIEAGGAGTGVSTWTGQVNGNTFTQATAAFRPAVGTAGPGGTASITADGTDDFLLSNWNPPAPLTTNSLIWAVFEVVTHVSGEAIWCGNGSSIFVLLTLATTGQVRMANITSGTTNGNMTQGVARRIESLYTGASDRLKIGNTQVSGFNAGNSDSTAFALFARSNGTLCLHGRCMDLMIVTGGDISGTEQANLDAYVSARYGSAALA